MMPWWDPTHQPRLLSETAEWAGGHGLEFPPRPGGPGEQRAGLDFMLEHQNFRDLIPEETVRSILPGDEVAILHRTKGWCEGTVVSVKNFFQNDDPFDATVMFRDRHGGTYMCPAGYIGRVIRK